MKALQELHYADVKPVLEAGDAIHVDDDLIVMKVKEKDALELYSHQYHLTRLQERSGFLEIDVIQATELYNILKVWLNK